MSRLPPHKRNFTTLYRAHFWHLKGLEAKVEKTQVEKHMIISTLAELDKLWQAMPIDQKRDVDPLYEVTEQTGGRWLEVKMLCCPHCGWKTEVSVDSDFPPRCSACMLDIDVIGPKVDADGAMERSTP